MISAYEMQQVVSRAVPVLKELLYTSQLLETHPVEADMIDQILVQGTQFLIDVMDQLERSNATVVFYENLFQQMVEPSREITRVLNEPAIRKVRRKLNKACALSPTVETSKSISRLRLQISPYRKSKSSAG